MQMSEGSQKNQEAKMNSGQDKNAFYRLKAPKVEEKARKSNQTRFRVIQKKDFLKGLNKLSIALKVDPNSLTDNLFQG